MSRPDAQPLFKGASAPKLQVRRKRLVLRRRLATFKPKLARLGLVVPAGGYFELPLLLKYCGRQRGAVVYRHSFRAKEYSAGFTGISFAKGGFTRAVSFVFEDTVRRVWR